MRAKTKTPDTYHINIDYVNVIRFGKITSNSTQQAENTSSAERQKTNFPKESVENADDLYDPVLNKIMTTHY